MTEYPVPDYFWQRYRTKYDLDSSVDDTHFHDLSEYMYDFVGTYKPGGTYTDFRPVRHWKVKRGCDYNYKFGKRTYKYRNIGFSNVSFAPQAFEKAYNEAYAKLDFKSNNDFELFTFLTDLDGSIAEFIRKTLSDLIPDSKRFVQKNRKVQQTFNTKKNRGIYGAFTWGLLPLVSDLTSLINTVVDLTSRLWKEVDNINTSGFSSQGFTTLMSSSGYVESFCAGKWRLRGTVTTPLLLSSVDLLRVILDELGVHPDLRTVWDVIPFSFVADYFVPIGDALESLHPRSWYNPTLETVDSTISYKGVEYISVKNGGGFKGLEACSAEFYFRDRVRKPITTEPPSEVLWESPSPKQIFNTAYLARSMRDAGISLYRRGRRRFS